MAQTTEEIVDEYLRELKVKPPAAVVVTALFMLELGHVEAKTAVFDQSTPIGEVYAWAHNSHPEILHPKRPFQVNITAIDNAD